MESERLPQEFVAILDADLAGYGQLTSKDDGVLVVLLRFPARAVTAGRSSVSAACTPDVC